ncbi:MAG: outer membrane protein assembly factor BamC [Arsenophonus sp.]
MKRLLIRLNLVILVGLLLSTFLIACSNNQYYDRQIIDDKSYLNTPPLKKLTVPKGMSLPRQNNEYDIFPDKKNGVTGKLLDIRPPIQVFSLLNKN